MRVEMSSRFLVKAFYLIVLFGLLLFLNKCVQSKEQVGLASWYGPGFHGKTTACGQTYNQHMLTIAHKTLPCGTLVTVTNLDNNRQISTVVTDRGPYVKGRIADLSFKVAKQLDTLKQGVVKIRLEH